MQIVPFNDPTNLTIEVDNVRYPLREGNSRIRAINLKSPTEMVTVNPGHAHCRTVLQMQNAWRDAMINYQDALNDARDKDRQKIKELKDQITWRHVSATAAGAAVGYCLHLFLQAYPLAGIPLLIARACWETPSTRLATRHLSRGADLVNLTYAGIELFSYFNETPANILIGFLEGIATGVEVQEAHVLRDGSKNRLDFISDLERQEKARQANVKQEIITRCSSLLKGGGDKEEISQLYSLFLRMEEGKDLYVNRDGSLEANNKGQEGRTLLQLLQSS